MARPAGDSERKLVEAAKALLVEQGFERLTVRAVAKRAGVNLGLVSYHFGGREALVRRASREVYDEFLAGLQVQVDPSADPLDNLRRVMMALGGFARTHRGFVISLVRDLLDDNAEARIFAKDNAPRHVVLLMGLVTECMKKGRLKKRPLVQVAPLMIGAVAVPMGMAHAVGLLGPRLPFGLSEKAAGAVLLSDKALRERLDLLFKALAA